MTENLHCSLDGSGPESLSRSRSELASKGSNGELVSLGKGGLHRRVPTVSVHALPRTRRRGWSPEGSEAGRASRAKRGHSMQVNPPV